jgi:hypothetical protein
MKDKKENNNNNNNSNKNKTDSHLWDATCWVEARSNCLNVEEAVQ